MGFRCRGLHLEPDRLRDDLSHIGDLASGWRGAEAAERRPSTARAYFR